VESEVQTRVYVRSRGVRVARNATPPAADLGADAVRWRRTIGRVPGTVGTGNGTGVQADCDAPTRFSPPMPTLDPERLLRAAFAAAIDAANPARCVAPALPPEPAGRTVVIGAGKAAAAMARAVETHWPGELCGTVVVPHGHAVACERIEVLESAHPVPAEAGQRAAGRLLGLVQGLGSDDLVLCLLSGGGSALLPLPAEGLSLEDKQSITHALLRSGASIGEINTVRRHLSRIKGGRLGVACRPARLVTLAISDVPGDAAIDIASGPTVADPTTCDDALAVLERYAIAVPSDVRAALRAGAWESVKPGDPRLAGTEFRLVATPQASLEAAARVARAAGVRPVILSDRLEGEAREVGRDMAALARRVVERGEPCAPPCLLLSGGETTVTVRGHGVGGRNVEFLLALGIALGPHGGVHAIAGDTDGIDGMAPVAGAVLRPDTLARAAALGLDPQAFLDDNDAHSLFARLGDQVVTGPTLTNVNDFRALLL
jgi:hydroxypyruvate reductase